MSLKCFYIYAREKIIKKMWYNDYIINAKKVNFIIKYCAQSMTDNT